MDLKNYYFTFGTAEHFPYKGGYLIVQAQSEENALKEFRKNFPDAHENTVNCAFWYSEKQWHKSENERAYGEPFVVIKEGDYDRTHTAPLTAESLTDFKYIDSKYYNDYHTAEHNFTCKVNGVETFLTYQVEKHTPQDIDFLIKNDNFNIWERMPEKELRKLDQILSVEADKAPYIRHLREAKTFKDLKDCEYEIMDSPLPYKATQELWKEHAARGKELETELAPRIMANVPGKMTFGEYGTSMLYSLLTEHNGHDLYNSKSGRYLCPYNEKNSIAEYMLSPSRIVGIMREMERTGTLEQANNDFLRHLGPGGRIYDSEEYLKEHEDDFIDMSDITTAEQHCRDVAREDGGWIWCDNLRTMFKDERWLDYEKQLQEEQNNEDIQTGDIDDL